MFKKLFWFLYKHNIILLWFDTGFVKGYHFDVWREKHPFRRINLFNGYFFIGIASRGTLHVLNRPKYKQSYIAAKGEDSWQSWKNYSRPVKSGIWK